MAYDSGDFKGPNGVNVGEILRVADLVERSATFDMSSTHHDCGTPACIAGHAMGAVSRREALFTSAKDATSILSLSQDAAYDLFYPSFDWAGCDAGQGDPNFITNAHAAACLRNLAATGEVDWLGTKPAVSK